MNECIMSGRLTADPVIKYTQGSNSMCVADFTLAVNRKYKRDGSPDADFFRCTAFGKTAEGIEKHVKKGTKLLITGAIQNDNYEKDGIKHYQMKIVIDSWEFAEGKKAAGEEVKDGETGYVQPTPKDDDNPFL